MAQTQTIGKHKTTIRTHDGYTKVRYHSTDVVRFNKSEIILDTGGYKTNTTKTRMNQASNQFDLGYRVYQKDYEWFIEYKGETIDFDGHRLVLNR